MNLFSKEAMMSDTKYGLMIYQTPHRLYNAGDYIQSLAAKQYLPHVNTYINREALAAYQGDPVKMIMNGWYMHNPAQWPPSSRIHPLFVSFHINAAVKDRLLTTEGVDYLKQYAPIGCRDLFTLNALQEKGVEAYHSGCLTTTLDIRYKAKEPERTDHIYFVDPLNKLPTWGEMSRSSGSLMNGIISGDIFKLGPFRDRVRARMLSRIFSRQVMDRAIHITQQYTDTHTEEQRFNTAAGLLAKYATARLVITSRIHCALPCLALGTPVIFLNYGFSEDTESSRLGGIMELFNVITIQDYGKKVSANFDFPMSGLFDEHNIPQNPSRHIPLAEALKKRCMEFVR